MAIIRYRLLVKADAPSLVLLLRDAECDEGGNGDKSTARIGVHTQDVLIGSTVVFSE